MEVLLRREGEKRLLEKNCSDSVSVRYSECIVALRKIILVLWKIEQKYSLDETAVAMKESVYMDIFDGRSMYREERGAD